MTIHNEDTDKDLNLIHILTDRNDSCPPISHVFSQSGCVNIII